MKFLKQVFAILLVVASGSAVAEDDIWCVGKIEMVRVYAPTAVYIKPDWHDKFIKICNLNGGWKSLNKETCQAWLAEFQIAKKLNTEVALRFDNTAYTCATLPEYPDGEPPYVVEF